MAAPISLLKVLLFLDLFSIIEFGNYSLSLLYGAFLSYLLASGNHEGLIKKLTYISQSEEERLIRNQLAKSFIAYILISIPLIILLAFVFVGTGVLNLTYSILAISTGFSISAFNLISVRWKIYGKFKVFGFFNFFRLACLTLPLLYSYFVVKIEISQILLMESLIAISFPILLAIYLRLYKTFHYSFLLKDYKDTLMVGLPLSIGALMKQLSFTLERTLAKINLSPEDFGLYSTFMIIFQILVILGGIIGSPLQREIIFKREEIGGLSTRKKLLVVQLSFVSICLGLYCIFIFFPSFLSFIDLQGFNNVTFFFVFLGSGIIAFSFYDSLVLAEGSGLSYVKRILICCFFILVVQLFIKDMLQPEWGMIEQGMLFLTFMFVLSIAAYSSSVKKI